MSKTLFETGGLRLVEDSETLYLFDGSEGYRITSEWHNPDTYLWQGDKTTLVVYHAFSEEEIRLAATEDRTLNAITGKKYNAASLCQLLAFGIRERQGAVDIDYLEKKYAATLQKEKPPQKQGDAPAGYKLHGTLRERIVEMLDVVGVGSYVDIDETREFYRQAGAPLLPKGEAFIECYGYLFCSMYPTFADEADDEAFRFDIFEDYQDGDPLDALREAGGEGSEMLRAVLSVAQCVVTPVGIFGCGDCATVYAGEDGKLYALHKGRPQVDTYNTLIDLLEVELKDHLPQTLLD